MEITQLFDSYSLQARVQPALLALLPPIIAIAAWFPGLYEWGTGLMGLALGCGAVVFLAHVARARGRKVQRRLFAVWGGKPSNLWLSHSNQRLDATTKGRYHDILASHINGWTAPSLEEESKDKQRAQEAYESAVRWLREKTRDRQRYSLVFKENVSYGFRRNLYGIKPLGICLALLSVAGNTWALYFQSWNGTTAATTQGLASLILNLLFLFSWVAVVRAQWVKDSADAYARALLAACDQIGIKNARN
ncbi:MAG: hypothetical protein OXI24_06895 [Candidatus Poribacteria bacterium]|nr:hypothetical protein [Candidatus Poribacteria bacterium]